MATNGLTLRRLRLNSHVRELSREVRVSTEQLIQPLFVADGIAAREPVPGLPGVYRETPDSLLQQIEADLAQGVKKFLLFGVPAQKKDRDFDHGFTACQIEAIKRRFGTDLFLAVDVCLCSSTDSGQCGVLSAEGDHVENGVTVDELAKQALLYADSGADCVAPSDMMDGRIGAIRGLLDSKNHERTLVMSYSAKFASRFYGPFRAAASSAPSAQCKLKDRSTYQIDPGRPRDALLSSLRDDAEGADILMVKPGMPYLDVLYRLSTEIQKPWAVYEVSGEYAAVEALAERDLIQGPAGHLEAWTAFARAGASMVITYGARHAKKWMESA